MVLVEERLVAGLGEHDEAEDAGERARGADRARGGGHGGGLERDGRESVDDVRRPCRVGHGELGAGRTRCMPLSVPIRSGRENGTHHSRRQRASGR